MKKIFLLRHAHAENNSANDFARILTPEGINKCAKTAEVLKEYINDIDVILCSSSARTTQTIETILAILEANKTVDYRIDLYHSDESKLLQELEKLKLQYNNILLVNHNPAISKLGKILAQNSKNSPSYQDILEGFSPGSLALYNLKQDDFIELSGFWR